jgi:hypothetical protein
LHSRFAALQWPNLAISFAQGRSWEAPRAFGPKDAGARARLRCRRGPRSRLSRAILAGRPGARRLLLIGRLGRRRADACRDRPASRTAHELVISGIAIRRLRTTTARVITRKDNSTVQPYSVYRRRIVDYGKDVSVEVKTVSKNGTAVGWLSYDCGPLTERQVGVSIFPGVFVTHANGRHREPA